MVNHPSSLQLSLSSSNQPDAQYVSASLYLHLKLQSPNIYTLRIFMERHQGERI
jgi:hypothetical protein